MILTLLTCAFLETGPICRADEVDLPAADAQACAETGEQVADAILAELTRKGVHAGVRWECVTEGVLG